MSTSEQYVATLTVAPYDDVRVSPPYAGVLANGIYQHALRHLGKIEHSQSLVALGGQAP